MDDSLYGAIFKRKSFHFFTNTGDAVLTEPELAELEAAYRRFEPLCPEIRTAIRIVPGGETSCRRGEQYCAMLYSEKKDGYLQNIGYLGEQLDLYLVSRDIGTLWFGMGKTEEKTYDGLDFVIMIAIRKIDDPAKFRKDMFKSKRKAVKEIWEGDNIADVADIVRFAPSACNSQPWFVRGAGNGELCVYRYRRPDWRGIMPSKMVPFFNRIDIGIFLCFLELCLAHAGLPYERELHTDDGSDGKYTLNAVYKL